MSDDPHTPNGKGTDDGWDFDGDDSVGWVPAHGATQGPASGATYGPASTTRWDQPAHTEDAAESDRKFSTPVLIAITAACTVIVLSLAGIAALFLGNSRTAEEDPSPISAGAATTTSFTTPRNSSGPSPEASAEQVGNSSADSLGASCSPDALAADLGGPTNSFRVVECTSGWAILVSNASGDGAVAHHSDGRWRWAEGLGLHSAVCPEEAIERGMPARMAREYFTNCVSTTTRSSTRSSTRETTTRRSSTPPRTSAPRPPTSVPTPDYTPPPPSEPPPSPTDPVVIEVPGLPDIEVTPGDEAGTGYDDAAYADTDYSEFGE